MLEADRIFEEHRPVLARLAYRMLGSLADADDVLQEAYLGAGPATAGRLCSHLVLICSRS